MGFDGLGLSHCILDYLNTNGFIEPTEIQKVSIPALIHDYNDVIVQAETGKCHLVLNLSYAFLDYSNTLDFLIIDNQ